MHSPLRSGKYITVNSGKHEISGSHVGEDVNVLLLCDAVLTQVDTNVLDRHT